MGDGLGHSKGRSWERGVRKVGGTGKIEEEEGVGVGNKGLREG